MKILNVYYGTNEHSFDDEPYHALCRYKADDELIAHYLQKAQIALVSKKCFWYLVSVLEHDAKTGETKHTFYKDGYPEKEKIILNAAAKKGLPTKQVIFTAPQPVVAWPIFEFAAPMTPETPIPF